MNKQFIGAILSLVMVFSVIGFPVTVSAQQLTQTEMMNLLVSLIQQLQKQLDELQKIQKSTSNKVYSQPTTVSSLARLDYVISIPDSGSKNVLLPGKNARLYGTYTDLPDAVTVTFKQNDARATYARGTLDFANAIQFQTPRLANGKYEMFIEWGNNKQSNDIAVQIGASNQSTGVVNIKTSYSREGYNDERIILHLSGGTSANPVKSWKVKFSCSSNIREASAKVWGDVCEGADDLKIGGSSRLGDTDIPLNLLYSNDAVGRLDIEIKALDGNDNVIGETETTISPRKG